MSESDRLGDVAQAEEAEHTRESSLPPSAAAPPPPPARPTWLNANTMFLAAGVAALLAALALGWPLQRALLAGASAEPTPTPVPGAGTPVRMSMMVESEPDGAVLTIEGNEVGVTPYMTNSFECVVGSTYALSLELEGYVPWKQDVPCLPGSEMARHKASLHKR